MHISIGAPRPAFDAREKPLNSRGVAMDRIDGKAGRVFKALSVVIQHRHQVFRAREQKNV